MIPRGLDVYAPRDPTGRVGQGTEEVPGPDVEALVVDVRSGVHTTLDEF